MSEVLAQRAAALASALTDSSQTLVTVESCTGGLIAATLTMVPGSSAWFAGGFVTYQPESKHTMVGVPTAVIDRWGVVSEPVAREMALGGCQHTNADIAVAVTGIAGPAGGEVDLPVGTVWFGWAQRDDTGTPQIAQTSRHLLNGDRAGIREAAVEIALAGILDLL